MVLRIFGGLAELPEINITRLILSLKNPGVLLWGAEQQIAGVHY